VSYQWDGEQRLVGIIQGTNQSHFAYDGLGQRIRILETSGGTTQSDRRFVWCGAEICEEWNSNNAVVNRYFDQGEQQGGTNLFYTRDHLGSVRELTDGTAAIHAQYAYAPYGSSSKLTGNLEANFGYTGHFRHIASGLDLTLYRAYDPGQARWLSRDPIMENGVNLYTYVLNDPVNETDTLGDTPILGPGGYLDQAQAIASQAYTSAKNVNWMGPDGKVDHALTAAYTAGADTYDAGSAVYSFAKGGAVAAYNQAGPLVPKISWPSWLGNKTIK